MGITFAVEYKLSISDVIADALSRQHSKDAFIMAISMPYLGLFDEIRQGQQTFTYISHLIDEIHEGSAPPQWIVKRACCFLKTEFI